MNDYKCADCGCFINEGEFKTFGVCDDCWDAHHKKQTAMTQSDCRACEIERNDEQVKQMPMHTCGKDGPIEYAQPKSAMTQSDAPNELGKEQFFKLIGAHPHHANATVIWDTLDLHGYVISKKLVDAPNKGREEKTAEQILAQYPALTKLVDFISDIEKSAIVLAMEEYTRDQLSKEREKHDAEIKRIQASCNQAIKDVKMDYDAYAAEREMRKELVENLQQYLCLFDEGGQIHQEIESLIAKASNL